MPELRELSYDTPPAPGDYRVDRGADGTTFSLGPPGTGQFAAWVLPAAIVLAVSGIAVGAVLVRTREFKLDPGAILLLVLGITAARQLIGFARHRGIASWVRVEPGRLFYSGAHTGGVAEELPGAPQAIIRVRRCWGEPWLLAVVAQTGGSWHTRTRRDFMLLYGINREQLETVASQIRAAMACTGGEKNGL